MSRIKVTEYIEHATAAQLAAGVPLPDIQASIAQATWFLIGRLPTIAEWDNAGHTAPLQLCHTIDDSEDD